MSSMHDAVKCQTAGCKKTVVFVGDARCRDCTVAGRSALLDREHWEARGATVCRDGEPVGTMASPSTAMRVARAMNDSQVDVSALADDDEDPLPSTKPGGAESAP